VADASAVQNLGDRTVEAFGTVDILVNNAGAAPFMSSLADARLEGWEKYFHVNFMSAVYGTKAVGPLMLLQGSGCILNIASVAGLIATPGEGYYGAAKAAMINLTRSLARVLGPAVRVNAIAPGVVDTRWIDGQRQFLQAAIAMTPLKRVATPEDVAEVALALVTAGDFVTGQTILVDGGRALVW
jgi:3-oxoacyl-[acyl-carrier protein] reductase